jgi:hypothetical protein
MISGISSTNSCSDLWQVQQSASGSTSTGNTFGKMDTDGDGSITNDGSIFFIQYCSRQSAGIHNMAKIPKRQTFSVFDNYCISNVMRRFPSLL